ncbi:MAG: hypothetical protein ACKVOH_06055 [Chlamydiales bacterium]
MKFGGGLLQGPESFHQIADHIIERLESYPEIVVVVSAMRGWTDDLIDLALHVNPMPQKREYDMLVSVGERVSIALLAMALGFKGKEAVSFTGSQSGIVTTGSHGEAEIIDVRPHRLITSLQGGKIVIVAGFQGVSLDKEITTLGRGGSDTSAVALAVALGAERVEFYKDVLGIYNDHPSQENAILCRYLTHASALTIVQETGGRILAPRAIILAEKNRMPLHVRSLSAEGTIIETEQSTITGPIYEYTTDSHIYAL